MFHNLDEAQRYVRDHEIQMVDLKYCDLRGSWHHITLPAGQLNQETLDEGVGFDGSSVGFRSVKSGDMVLVPDLSTGTLDPFWDLPTLSFVCTTLEADTHNIFANDPRNVAIRAEAYLRETGIADESRWGPEFEFYVFDRVTFENGPNHASYLLESSEAEWNSADNCQPHPIKLHGGYHAIPPHDQHYDLRSTISKYLLQMGIPVKYHHHEVGSSGQCEVETSLMGLVQSGDAAMMIMYVTRMAARAEGKSATFMPKPLYGEAGNGMHFHQLLLKEGMNLFYDPQGYGNLSQTALYYIGGMLKHGAALLALTNPSTNSYRRLVPGFEAPVNLFFSLGNRSAAIRIPKYAHQPHSTRFEFRPPDATCNVYLALAAQLLAGLDGIRNKIDPTEQGFGPIDEDIFSWTSQKRETIQRLPGSLDIALQALEADHDFLLAGDVFSREMIHQWIDYKMKAEFFQVLNRPHPYEMFLYY